jgi:F1F0 ATPase subunit 2
MIEPYILALAAGLSLGTIFFGGLWWTIRIGARSQQPAVWFFLSFVLRMAIVLAGFYSVLAGDWRRLVVCLVGFVIARVMVMRLTRQQLEAGAK